MRFDKKFHDAFYEENRLLHSETCLCKKFKDGEEMWKPEIPVQRAAEKAEARPTRDPSQSEQPWDKRTDTGRTMDKLFDE